MFKKRNLTPFYTVHQMLYWAIPGGIASFAATYLLDHGYSNSSIGVILFGACFFSFLLQPIIGSFADKIGKNVLPYLMFGLAMISALLLSSLLIFNLSIITFGIVYMFSNVFIDMQNPLLNSVSVYYSLRKWNINYAFGRGVGALGFGIATLLFGRLIENFGSNIMPLICICLTIIYALLALVYPKDNSKVEQMGDESKDSASSLFTFIKKYEWYSLSLLSFLLFAIFHCMAENYLIQIVTPIGGNSSNVGTALFISTIVEIPFTVIFGSFYSRLGSKKIIYIGGIFYIVKALIMLLATKMLGIYVAQALQCLNYVMINTVEVYYAKECTTNADMVKSQTLITAFFSLGCAFGNLAGGTIIDLLGIKAMMIFGLGISAAGVVVGIFTIQKALDFKKEIVGN